MLVTGMFNFSEFKIFCSSTWRYSVLDKKTNSFFMADRIQLRTMQTGIGAYKLTPPFLASVLFHNITSLQWSSLRPWRPKQYRREDALPNLLISLLFFSMCIEPRVINIYSFLNFCTSTLQLLFFPFAKIYKCLQKKLSHLETLICPKVVKMSGLSLWLPCPQWLEICNFCLK